MWAPTLEHGSCPPHRVREARLETAISETLQAFGGRGDAPWQTGYLYRRFGELLANRSRRHRDKPAFVLERVDHGESHGRDGVNAPQSPASVLLWTFLGLCSSPSTFSISRAVQMAHPERFG